MSPFTRQELDEHNRIEDANVKERRGGATTKRALEVCKDIVADMASDATKFDGQPFTGRTVAEYFGTQGAAIAALAQILERHLQEHEECDAAPFQRSSET
jgi:hypothetical protein